jgi:hypothetical protein
MHKTEDEYFKKVVENNLRRKEGYFNRYIKFKATCVEKGISEAEIPMLWIAYQLDKIEYGMR